MGKFSAAFNYGSHIPNWTIADFFEYEVKRHLYSWYLDQINKGVKHEEMKAYKINGKIYWCKDDGGELSWSRHEKVIFYTDGLILKINLVCWLKTF